MITLYRAPFSTNVERVALALAHKGLEVKSVVVDYADRGVVEAASGQGLVPVIVDGEQVVSDSLAILRHLGRRHPNPPLFPRTDPRRAELELFLDWLDRVWKVAPNAIEDELAAQAPARDRLARLSATMADHLELFERMLVGRSHLFGELSAADFAAFPFLKYARWRDPADDELFHRILDDHQQLGAEHPRLSDWIERMDAMPRAY